MHFLPLHLDPMQLSILSIGLVLVALVSAVSGQQENNVIADLVREGLNPKDKQLLNSLENASGNMETSPSSIEASEKTANSTESSKEVDTTSLVNKTDSEPSSPDTPGKAIKVDEASANERKRSARKDQRLEVRSPFNTDPKRNPWATYPGMYPADTSPMYTGNSSYNPSGIHLLYLSNNRVASCRPARGAIDISRMAERGLSHLRSSTDEEKKAASRGHFVPVMEPTSEGRHQLTGKRGADELAEQQRSYLIEFVSRQYKRRMCLPNADVPSYLSKIPPPPNIPCRTTYDPAGGSAAACKPSKYRTIDGSCNNLLHPFWGKANVCHTRFLPAAYEDGISSPRVHSVTGRPLRDPRFLSASLITVKEDPAHLTNWHTVWGQYLIHDMVSTPQAQADHDQLVKCCPEARAKSAPNPDKCLPIMLPKSDVQAKVRECINFIRSAPCPVCKLGLLRATNTPHGELLPDPDNVKEDQCSKLSVPNHVCFKSGDNRVNQHPPLQLLHTLWVRRHNQHARGLVSAKPSLASKDELVFQEARRITIAEFQHITYSEYLSPLLGAELMQYYDLDVTQSLFCAYDPTVNPTTWNEFVTAAGRFGHSQIKSMFPLNMNISLKDNFFNPEAMRGGMGDVIGEGLLKEAASVVDPYFSMAIKNFLYSHKDKLNGFGGDLAAFNIQRGRDHGLPPYFAFLKFCFNFEARSWSDIRLFVEENAFREMVKTYEDYRDVDLYIGGLSERKLRNSHLGPTFGCLMGLQFNAAKLGDRYFYSHYGQTGSFTPEQLSEIKSKFSLANFLCLTLNGLKKVPKFAFLPPSSGNPEIPCSHFRSHGWLNHRLFAGSL